MKRFLRIVVAAFALIGVGYVLFALYVFKFLPKCAASSSEALVSPDGKFYAVVTRSDCEQRARTHAYVEMGRPGEKERIVSLEVQGTTEARMSWNGDRELIVSFPPAAVVKAYAPDDEWPRVVQRHLEP